MEILGVTMTSLEYLREKIITGELKAGQRLNETELSMELGISRPPLREAFRILEENQLIVSMPRKGTFVAEISIEDFVEIYQAREMLECHCIDLIQEKNIKTFPLLERAIEASATLSIPPDDKPKEKMAFLEAFAAFHHRLIESAGNKQLIHFYKRIGFHLSRYQFMYAYLPGLTDLSQDAHWEILNHIKEGRFLEAKQLVRYHIRSFVQLMRTRMSLKA
jgi:DNA-binding GntR family transcriptional regulator